MVMNLMLVIQSGMAGLPGHPREPCIGKGFQFDFRKRSHATLIGFRHGFYAYKSEEI